MDLKKTYTADELILLLEHLEKSDEQDKEMPKKRIREKVKVEGKEKWISGYTIQELCDSYVTILEKEGLIEKVTGDDVPLFGEYLLNFYSTFRKKQGSNTIVNRNRLIKNHIIPEFGNKRLDRISTMDLQKWFNKIGEKYALETASKLKNIMNPVFDSAIEDEYLTRNPLRSKRLEVVGKETVHHTAIPSDKIKTVKENIKALEGKVKVMAGLLCYTGMRYEEVLGLKWEDISGDWITIRRAVIHPKRNMPEIKSTKTKTSARMIPLVPELKMLFDRPYSKGFLLHSDKDPSRETPLSYTEARRIFKKVQISLGLENYSAHDFRDTCATVWRENGMPLDMIARLLGHAKTETTERRYVKYRPDLMLEAAKMM